MDKIATGPGDTSSPVSREIEISGSSGTSVHQQENSLPVRPLKSGGFDLGAWWMLAVLFSLYVLSYVDRQIVSMLVPDIKRDLELSEFQMGLILGPAFAIVYSVCSIPVGWLTDAFPRRWIIFLGACVFGIATYISGHADTFGLLLVARILVGVGEATLTPAATSLLASRFPRHLLTTALSIYSTATKVGASVAYTVGGLLIGAAAIWVMTYPPLEGFQAWQLVFMLCGAPTVVIALLVFTFKEPEREIRRNSAGKASGINTFIWQRKGLFMPLLFGFSMVALCSAGLTAWTPTYIVRHFGMSAQQYGPALGIISLAAAAALPAKGILIDWFYRRGVKDAHVRVYTWLLIGALPLFASLFFIENPLLFLVMFGALQLVAVSIAAYAMAAVSMVVPPNLRGRIIGVVLFCLNGLGAALGPLIVGGITEYILRDEAKLGLSMTIMFAIFIPPALILLRMALKPFKAAVIEAESQLGKHG